MIQKISPIILIKNNNLKAKIENDKIKFEEKEKIWSEIPYSRINSPPLISYPIFFVGTILFYKFTLKFLEIQALPDFLSYNQFLWGNIVINTVIKIEFCNYSTSVLDFNLFEYKWIWEKYNFEQFQIRNFFLE